jgi:hypothetical protein
MLAHTIADTWCGVEIFFIIDSSAEENDSARIIDHAPTRQYLVDFAGRQDALSARVKYQLTTLLHRFDLPVGRLPPVGRATQTFRSYEELYYLLASGEQEQKTTAVPDQGGFFNLPWKTVRECFFYVRLQGKRLLQAAGEQERKALADWLAASQNLDGGFGFYPGTTSFVENCFYGLDALNILRAQPANAVRASAFILACQTGAGGFARNPMAAPFLDSSLEALRALAALQNMTGRS